MLRTREADDAVPCAITGDWLAAHDCSKQAETGDSVSIQDIQAGALDLAPTSARARHATSAHNPIPLDDVPLNAFHFKIAGLTFGANFTEGYALGTIGYALASLNRQMPLDAFWMGMIGSSALMQFRFVSSGANPTETTAPVVSLGFVTSDGPGQWGQGNLYTGTATGTLTQATCSVTQSSIAVSLP